MSRLINARLDILYIAGKNKFLNKARTIGNRLHGLIGSLA
ncbi:hypothetical protein LY85_0555 [Clostridium sp. KNHs216]|nr:hypothetical protein LY85_0555 [Clostridium sp. KNHs216]